jgi:hypothetical protein
LSELGGREKSTIFISTSPQPKLRRKKCNALKKIEQLKREMKFKSHNIGGKGKLAIVISIAQA